MHGALDEAGGRGDDTRSGLFYKGQSLYFSFVNCSKECIVLNLKEEGAIAVSC